MSCSKNMPASTSTWNVCTSGRSTRCCDAPEISKAWTNSLKSNFELVKFFTRYEGASDGGCNGGTWCCRFYFQRADSGCGNQLSDLFPRFQAHRESRCDESNRVPSHPGN